MINGSLVFRFDKEKEIALNSNYHKINDVQMNESSVLPRCLWIYRIEIFILDAAHLYKMNNLFTWESRIRTRNVHFILITVNNTVHWPNSSQFMILPDEFTWNRRVRIAHH